MAVSKEVQDVLDKARAAQTLRASTAQAMNALQQQNADQKAKIDALTAQLAAIPAGSVLSADDKAALLEAGQDLVDGNADTSTLISDAHAAIPANIVPGADGGPASAPAAAAPVIGDVIHTPEQLAANGPANAPAGGLAPLMPNSSFNPSPGGVTQPAVPGGQPAQAPVTETAGGFVVAGGGSTAVAAGASPASPSSSVVSAAVDTPPSDPAPAAPASSPVPPAPVAPSSGQAPASSSPAPSSPVTPPAPNPSSTSSQQAAQQQLASDQAAAEKAKTDQQAAAAKDGEQVQNPS